MRYYSVLLCVLVLSGCSQTRHNKHVHKPKSKETGLESIDLRGSIKRYEIKSCSVVNGDTTNYKTSMAFTFDRKGYMTESVVYISDGRVRTTTVTRDANEQIVKEVEHNSDGSADVIRMYTYDAKGNNIEVDHHLEPGHRVLRDFYTYDENGNQTEGITNADSPEKLHWKAEYDGNFNQKKITFYKGDTAIESFFDYIYDSDGNMTESREYDEKGTLTHLRTMKYNAAGNKTEEVQVGFSKIRITYTYDEKGNEVESDFYEEDKTEPTSIIRNTNDAVANCIKAITYSNGKVISVQVNAITYYQ